MKIKMFLKVIGPSLWTSGLLDFFSLDTDFGINTSFEHDTKPNKASEEFVKWVFAEDKEISEGVSGKFTLEISGCSRPELNGNYVQQTEYYYRRPIFHCQEKGRYLFYHGKRHLDIPLRLGLRLVFS